MSINFDKIDLINDETMLVIAKEDGTTDFIDESIATEEEKAIIMAFKENYYQKYDIFKIDKTMQQCQVISRPHRVADNYWEVEVRLIDNDYSTTLDTSGCQIGDTTRFQSNAIENLIMQVLSVALLSD